MKDTLLVHSHDISVDEAYIQWIGDIKNRYKNAQIKAALKINSEQLLFNWQLGRDLVEEKVEEKWGKGIVEQLSLDLQAAFPDAKGFSARNLWFMKQWYSFYLSGCEKINELESSEALFGTENKKLNQVGSEINNKKLNQAGSALEFPQLFAYVPWRHHVLIVQKSSSVEEALFYIKKTVEEGLSRSALENYICADLYHVAGTAITNFEEKLPIDQGKIAQEILKGNYDLGFVSLPNDYDEITLEDALEQRMTRFLLELGTGWAFVGRQKEIIISGSNNAYGSGYL